MTIRLLTDYGASRSIDCDGDPLVKILVSLLEQQVAQYPHASMEEVVWELCRRFIEGEYDSVICGDCGAQSWEDPCETCGNVPQDLVCAGPKPDSQ